jgi:hypothetical protein
MPDGRVGAQILPDGVAFTVATGGIVGHSEDGELSLIGGLF